MVLDGIYIYDTENKKLKKELREKTEDVTQTQNKKFSDFKLSRNILKAIYSAGFEYPSPIQNEAIPVILERYHVLARSKSGTGKTAAFTIPALELVDLNHLCTQVIIINPSRELATQTHQVVKKMGSLCEIKSTLCIGGTNLKENIEKIANDCHILVGTPGRILHLLNMNKITGYNCHLIILDEADVLLSENFIETIKEIFHLTNPSKQVLLFSATFPNSVESFSNTYMSNAIKINTMECLTLRGVTPFYVYLDERQKLKCLSYLMNNLTVNQSIIFVNSVKRAEMLYESMRSSDFSCICIHSKMAQDKRSRIYNEFKAGKFRNLVSTNLFTRGIDIATVNIVINFDFPSSLETYLHRIGRSGRFGQVGLSIEMITDKDKMNFYKIEKDLNIDIKRLPEKVDLKLYN